MLYDLTKAAHLIALFVWLGGMAAVALALRYPALVHMKPLRAYDRAVSSPAMILALLFGISLGVQGGWFTSAWLGMKIVLVLGLSGLHGALVGKLRRAVQDNGGDAKPTGGLFLFVGLALLSLIVLLVTIKP
ncbi:MULTISPECIES: CopD family protein [Pacificibacter]|uniref:CopD family protein n=1 Tax=Pacificibacter TaxID=1042323 RepID=UPI001C0A13FE|nr:MULTISPECIES: CopD family protein [Pacificibacter]MBU2934889.1 CopD family protein [Pacificibacter marinus]MDO6617350.1 CopD family protein [Pacificibacter sp. 1_MG-2023]